MIDYGIICETNPIHNGHKLLIDYARQKGADRVVCIMSGNVVQRGEFAVADKYTRAEVLIKCGADLVVELPFPWSSGSADYFSAAGVYIAASLCDRLIFGSECGDIALLNSIADEAGSASFRDEYFNRLSCGEQAASLYYSMIEERAGRKLLSNDLLGMEYIRSAKKLGLDMEFDTITRRGDKYSDESISHETFVSAMAIRKLWRDGDISATMAYMPKEAYGIYSTAFNSGKMPEMSNLDDIILSFFRLHSGEDFENIVGASGGLANRICASARKARTLEELFELTKNKRYTDSAIRRVMLYCMAGVTRADLESMPEETLLLAASCEGRRLLSKKRNDNSIRIVTKPADINKQLRQNQLNDKIEAIYSLLYKDKLSADEYYKKRPYMS